MVVWVGRGGGARGGDVAQQGKGCWRRLLHRRGLLRLADAGVLLVRGPAEAARLCLAVHRRPIVQLRQHAAKVLWGDTGEAGRGGLRAGGRGATCAVGTVLSSRPCRRRCRQGCGEGQA